MKKVLIGFLCGVAAMTLLGFVDGVKEVTRFTEFNLFYYGVELGTMQSYILSDKDKQFAEANYGKGVDDPRVDCYSMALGGVIDSMYIEESMKSLDWPTMLIANYLKSIALAKKKLGIK